MAKRRRHKDTGVTPTPTSSKWTNIRDPRATVRFSLDERVAWDEGDRIVLGVVIGFPDDECAIKVRLENGCTVIWPTVSSRLRRVQTPEYSEDQSMATTVEDTTKFAPLEDIAAAIAADDDAYERIEVERSEHRTDDDLGETIATFSDDHGGVRQR